MVSTNGNDLISSLTHSISFRLLHRLLTPFLCPLGRVPALCRLAHLACAHAYVMFGVPVGYVFGPDL